MGKALGLIEFIGYVPAICAADTALKAANVSLIGIEKVTGGIVTVKVTGDVDAVYAAIESAESFASRVGSLRGTHVIPRLDDEVEALLINEKKECERLRKLEDENALAKKIEVEVNEEADIAIQNEIKVQEEIQEDDSKIEDDNKESKITIQIKATETLEDEDEEIIQVEIEEVKAEEDIEQEVEKLKNIVEIRDEFVEINKETNLEKNSSEKDIIEDIKEVVSKDNLDREEKVEEFEIDIKKISKMRVKDLRKKIKSLNPSINTNKLKSLKKKDLVDILLKYAKEGEN